MFDEDNYKVGRMRTNSGLAAVVPAWRLTDLLESEERVTKPRARREAELADELKHGSAAILDAAEQPDSDELARTRDLTEGLLRVPKKELDEKRKEKDG